MKAYELPGAAVTVIPGRASGALAAPGSKSVTNRLLILAALAEGESLLRHPLDSDDTRAMRGLIEALGAVVTDDAAGWKVAGTGGRLQPQSAGLDARLSGTTMRFGAALAALAKDPVTVSGDAPLLRRPIGPLTAALQQLGANVSDHDGLPPLRSEGGGVAGGSATVEVSASSQFASALLLIAPYAQNDVVVTLQGHSAISYIELTAEAMREWGVHITREGAQWHIARGSYQARDVDVEYDASAAAHLYTLAAASGGAVTVTNVAAESLQADAGFPRLLAAMGCGVQLDEDAITVAGPVTLSGLGDCDLGAMPDQLPNAAVLAALAEGETTLRNVAVVRGHETDRISALATELKKLGVQVEELPDGLRIVGGVTPPARPVHLHTYDDHRLAMAFAALATAVPNIVIEDAACVRKTYPQFWSDLKRLGVAWQETA